MDGQRTIYYLFWLICWNCTLLFHCPFHIIESILFHVFIYIVCLSQILFIMFNKYHFSFVYICHFVVCMYILPGWGFTLGTCTQDLMHWMLSVMWAWLWEENLGRKREMEVFYYGSTSEGRNWVSPPLGHQCNTGVGQRSNFIRPRS